MPHTRKRRDLCVMQFTTVESVTTTARISRSVPAWLRKNSYSNAFTHSPSSFRHCRACRLSLDRVRAPCMGKTAPYFFTQPAFADDGGQEGSSTYKQLNYEFMTLDTSITLSGLEVETYV